MIFKFQQGGALPPLVSYNPVIVQGPQSTASNAQPESGVDLTDKDVLKLLEDLNGLPSDTQALINKLQNFAINANSSNVVSRYLSTIRDIKLLEFNNKEYEDAFKIVSENGGINEIAINDRGYVFCVNKKDSNDFQLLSPEDLIKSKEYVPLTNSDLLNIRAYDLPYDSNILKVVKNGISMEKITKMIQDIIKDLGTTETSREGYTSIRNKQVINGINILKEAVQKGAFTGDELSIDGLYKNEIITKTQAEQAQYAIEYIKRYLPQNARSLLKLRSDGTDKGVDAMITMLTCAYTGTTVNFKSDFQENVNSDGTKRSESGEDFKINPAMAFQLDMGVETVLPLVAGSTDALFLQAYRMPVTTKSGNPLGITTLDKVSDTSALGGIFDFSHVTMGDQVLDMASSKNVVVDGSSIYKVYLPFDQTKAAKGIITPNLNYITLLEKVRKEIKETGASTPEEINAIYEKNNLPPFVDMNGKVNEQFYKPFGVMNATALSDAFPTSVDLNNNSNFEEVDDDNEINNYWSIIKGDNTKESFDSKSWYNNVFGDYQQMWKGLVYLPLNSTDPTLGAYSGGTDLSVSEYQEYKARYDQEQRLRTYNPQGQLQI